MLKDFVFSMSDNSSLGKINLEDIEACDEDSLSNDDIIFEDLP